MAVWVVMPSKRPPEEAGKCLSKWREMGYKIALFVDDGSEPHSNIVPEYVRAGAYPGYAQAVNGLVVDVLGCDPSCDWIVAAGDDMLPDPNKRADEIATECRHYFEEPILPKEHDDVLRWGNFTFGVMQPTGDRDWGDRRGPYCDFVAGSAWMGREWCQRINQGNGPLWPDYFHMGVDEELQAVAIKYGVFWQRQDLTHKHLNWGRPTKPGQRLVDVSEMPDFLVKANSPSEWNKYKRIFKERSEAGFPGSEPL